LANAKSLYYLPAIPAEFSSKAEEIGHSSSEIVRKLFSEDGRFSALQSPAGIADYLLRHCEITNF
jgi:hypothetical protein